MRCMNIYLAINVVLEVAKGHRLKIPWPVQIIKVFGKNTSLITQLEV